MSKKTMNYESVVALMAVKTNDKDKVGSWDMKGQSTDTMFIGPVKAREVETYTESDFDEPSRENFVNFLKDVYEHPENTDNDVTCYFLESVDEIKGLREVNEDEN